jgi:1-acyl-sn-glycerol-3-phosphate acyltransferase
MTDPVRTTRPRYRHPKRVVLEITWAVLIGRRRCFSADAAWLVASAPVPPRVERANLIPADRPFVVVVNHYHRPGLDAWWGPLLVSHAVTLHRPAGRGEVHWGMASRWTYPADDWFGRRVKEPLTAALFPRLAHVLGFIPMPPIPPRPEEAAVRARAVRQFLALAQDPDALIGLVPEGRDSPDASLVAPPPGAGRFMLQLGKTGRLILPAGVTERDGALTAVFGPPFHLDLSAGTDGGRLSTEAVGRLSIAAKEAAIGRLSIAAKEAADRQASTRIMVAIGRCLPPALWGEFRAEIEARPGAQAPG